MLSILPVLTDLDIAPFTWDADESFLVPVLGEQLPGMTAHVSYVRLRNVTGASVTMDVLNFGAAQSISVPSLASRTVREDCCGPLTRALLASGALRQEGYWRHKTDIPVDPTIPADAVDLKVTSTQISETTVQSALESLCAKCATTSSTSLRNADPDAGDVYWDTDEGTLVWWDGEKYVRFAAGQLETVDEE